MFTLTLKRLAAIRRAQDGFDVEPDPNNGWGFFYADTTGARRRSSVAKQMFHHGYLDHDQQWGFPSPLGHEALAEHWTPLLEARFKAGEFDSGSTTAR